MACSSNLRLAEENEGRKADMADIADNVPRALQCEKAWKRVTLAKKTKSFDTDVGRED